MRTHTRDSLAALIQAGAAPELVQLGNEITNGTLWETGRVSPTSDANWDSLGALLRAARLGVDDAYAVAGQLVGQGLGRVDPDVRR